MPGHSELLLLVALIVAVSSLSPLLLELHCVEEQAPPILVGLLSFSPGFKVVYANDSHQKLFEVDSQNGSVYAVQRIDRDYMSGDVVSLFILTEGTCHEVQIFVDDLNDNAPKFSTQVFGVAISENVEEGYQINLPSAQDIDFGVNGTISMYDIQSGNTEGTFSLKFHVRNGTLVLQVVKTLDREHIDFFQLKIVASDSGSPAQIGVLVVNINVLDENDNKPVFQNATSKMDFPENISVGSILHRFSAADVDAGENGTICFMLKDKSDIFFLSEDGTLVVTQSLDYEKEKVYILKVVVRDYGYVSLTNEASIMVQVTDVNDHVPHISFSEPLPLHIKENEARSVMLSITDSDSDIANGALSLKILSKFSETFVLIPFSATDNVYILKPSTLLDREQRSEYTLTIEASDTGNPRLSSNVTITVIVDDENDCIPEFFDASYKVSIPEDVPVGSFVFAVGAFDCDYGENGRMSFYFEDKGFKLLDLDSVSGVIVVKSSLKLEVLKVNNLLVSIIVQDHGSPAKKSMQVLELSIIDVNDHAPQVVEGSLVLNVDENLQPGHLLGVYRATDMDSGSNGDISYFLGHSGIDYLALNSTSGLLKSKKDFDYELLQYLTFSIHAIDGGLPPKSAVWAVTVVVGNVNDNHPKFMQSCYVAVVDIDKISDPILVASASDADLAPFGNVTYSLTSGLGLFEINQNTGSLYMKLPTVGMYKLEVRAQDQMGLEGHANIVIYVVPEIKQRPIFTRRYYSFFMNESVPIGFPIGKVDMLTPDHETQLFLTVGNYDETFSISNVGLVTLQRVVDRELQSTYKLQVVAVKNSTEGLASSAFITIYVMDVNDCKPRFNFDSFNVQIREDSVVGTLVFAATAQDCDSGSNGQLSYSLIDDGLGRFAVNSLTGSVFLASEIIYDQNLFYLLKVRAQDAGVPSRDTHAVVKVYVSKPLPSKPEFPEYPLVLNVSSTAPVSFVIHRLQPVNHRSRFRGQYAYELTYSSTKKFGVYPNGLLYVLHELGDAAEWNDVTVTACHILNSSLCSSVRLIVFVRRANERLLTRALYEFTLKGPVRANSVVGNLNVFAHKINSSFLVTRISDQPFLAVNPETLQIITKIDIDRTYLDMFPNHEKIALLVEIMISGKDLHETCVIYVYVQSNSQRASAFTRNQYQIAVLEETLHPFALLDFSSLLAFEYSGNETFRILSGNDGNSFALSSSGRLILEKPLDRETVSMYNLTVSVQSASWSSTTNALITVMDKNDNSPKFSSHNAILSIPENTAVGSLLILVRAIDADAGENAFLSYLIDSGNDDQTFVLDLYTGELSLLKALDYELTRKYTLVVKASDRGEQSFSNAMTLEVIVLDVNDNAPVFESLPDTLHITENLAAGTQIMKVTATDRDFGSNGNIHYSVDLSSIAYVVMEPLSGVLYTRVSPKREYIKQFNLTVAATDQASDLSSRLSTKKTILVAIDDVNDHAPQILSPRAVVISSVAFACDVPVYTVAAEDEDAGHNGTLTHRIVGGADAAIFKINESTGDVFLCRTWPAGTWFTTLRIEVADLGIPRLFTQFDLLFFWEGRNSAFEFQSGSYHASIKENSPTDTNVVQVGASYLVPQSSSIKYFITRGNEKARFLLDEDTGMISTGIALDYEAMASKVTLEVYALDMRSRSSVTARASVVIQVRDENDNSPTFPSGNYFVSVPENSGTGYVVVTVTALDADDGMNGQLLYTIDDGNEDGVFHVNSRTGSVILIKDVDFEVRYLYDLAIVATDQGSLQRTGTTRILVEVLDSNDNAPMFNRTEYVFSVAENADVGSIVGYVVASDKDSGHNGEVYYELELVGDSYFSVDISSGAIYVEREIDYEDVQVFLLSIKAYDGGSPINTNVTSVIINIIDENDNIPLFLDCQTLLRVREGTPVGASIVQAVALDYDYGVFGLVSYRLLSQQYIPFTVSKNGTVYTTAVIDREHRSHYSLTVAASDDAAFPAQRTSYLHLSVVVEDINDNAPVFTSSTHLHLSESSPVGIVVAAFSAVDWDVGINAQMGFSLLPGSDSVFQLSRGGDLKLRRPLDYESSSAFMLQMLISDAGNPSLSTAVRVSVQIDDENDNYPMFSGVPSPISINESVTAGTVLYTFAATDADSGSNGLVSYSLLTYKELFSVDSVTGALSVGKHPVFNFSSYNLLISAFDHGVPSKKSSTELMVLILDVNDHAPEFEQRFYSAFIEENRGPVSSLIRLKAVDKDRGLNSLISYQLAGDDTVRSYFSIDSFSGALALRQPIDREVISSFKFTVFARDSGFPVLSGSCSLEVTVLDVNDNSPKLGQGIQARIKENAAPYTRVVKLDGFDPDSGSNGTVSFYIKPENPFFYVEEVTGFIVSKVSFDYENVSVYSVLVTVMDGGNPPLFTTSTVNVYVEDANDEAPRFSEKSYLVDFPEGVAPGTLITILSAVDKDSPANGKIRYSISSNHTLFFRIDADSGEMISVLQFKTEAEYEVEVKAEDVDFAAFFDVAVVKVRIRGSSLFPLFQRSLQVVRIEEANSTFIIQPFLRVPLASEDFSEVDYSLLTERNTAGNTSALFFVNSKSGELYLRKELDYERQQKHVLRVKAASTVSPSYYSYATVVVLVLNINDNPPAFRLSEFLFYVAENTPVGSSIGEITAVDADGVNPYLKYELTDNDSFYVNASTGIIVSKQNLDYEKRAVFRLSATVFDARVPSERGYANLVVALTDQNDNAPVVPSVIRIAVSENIAIGFEILTIRVTDPDAGASIWFRLDPATSVVSLDRRSGRIASASLFDREKAAMHNVTVLVSDGKYTVRCAVVITVLDVNDCPPLFQADPIVIHVPENAALDQQIFQFVARDDDVGVNAESFYRSLDLASAAAGALNLTWTGRLVLKSVLSYQTFVPGTADPNVMAFTVQAVNVYDPHFSASAAVRLVVDDVNDHAPVFTKSAYVSHISELTTVGAPIVTVEAFDRMDSKENADVTYSVASRSHADVFVINSAGVVFLNKPVAAFRGQWLDADVRAVDKGTPAQSASCKLQVFVEGLNLHSPSFAATSYSNVVAENYPIQRSVAQFSAVDKDTGPNGEMTYSISSGNDNGIWAIDERNGTVTLAQSLDYELVQSYVLVVTAKDGCVTSPRTGSVHWFVTVADVNDNAPMFSQGVFRIFVRENEGPRRNIFQLSATDKDSSANGEISYAIRDDAAKAYFNLSVSGALSTTVIFDYEQGSEYLFRVSAEDRGPSPLSSIASVLVTIEGVNEYPPVFAQNFYNFSVSEHAKEGTVVGVVMASDKDAGLDGQCQYFIASASKRHPLRVQRKSGTIVVSGRLSIGAVTLEVLVRNEGDDRTDLFDTTFVRVDVYDANDAPVFERAVYSVQIAENASVGTVLHQVSAFDPDSGSSSGLVRYSLWDPTNTFIIDERNGSVSIGKPLDRELADSYELRLAAVDGYVVPATGYAKLSVLILDTNDNPPIVRDCFCQVYENVVPGTEVLKLSVLDSDIDPNKGPYSFKMETETDLLPFQIDAASGVLTVASRLDRESADSFAFKASVADNGRPQLSSLFTCLVEILDVSDSPAYPRNVTVHVNFYENLFRGGPLGDVSPVDLDVTDAYSCNVSYGLPPWFTFRQSSCILESSPVIGKKAFDIIYGGTLIGAPSDYVPCSVHLEFNPVFAADLADALFIAVSSYTLEQMVSRIGEFSSMLRSAYANQADVIPRLFSVQYLNGRNDILLVFSTGGNRTRLENVLVNNQRAVERLLGAPLKFDVENCSAESCSSSGKCHLSFSLTAEVTKIETRSDIFHSLQVRVNESCMCDPGRVGTRCQLIPVTCSPMPCHNNGSCSLVQGLLQCRCPVQFWGTYCEYDVDECADAPCKNGAACLNVFGGFSCICLPKFTGLRCDVEVDACVPNPCSGNAPCAREGSGFKCQCPFGSSGARCEVSGLRVDAASHVKLDAALNDNVTQTSIEFATMQSEVFLIGALSVDHEQMIAVYSSAGIVKVAVVMSGTKLVVDGVVHVADGMFHTCVLRTTKEGLNLVVDGKASFATADLSDLKLSRMTLYMAGVPSPVDPLLRRHHLAAFDFVGCIKRVLVNDNETNLSSIRSRGTSLGCQRGAGCNLQSCGRRATCVDLWSKTECVCEGVRGRDCRSVDSAVQLRPGGSVKLSLTESYRRSAQLRDFLGKSKRSIAEDPSIIGVKFRTRSSGGVLLYARGEEDAYSKLYLKDRLLQYEFGVGRNVSGSCSLTQVYVSDGRWHNATVRISGLSVRISCDNVQSEVNVFSTPPPPIVASDLSYIVLGETDLDREGRGDWFVGCIEWVRINQDSAYVSGWTSLFNVTVTGDVGTGCVASDVCASNPCIGLTLPYCVDEWEQHACVAPGFCTKKPCLHDSRCVPSNQTYRCDCSRTNFTGELCEIPLACLEQPCGDSERCVADKSGFRCELISANSSSTGLSKSLVLAISLSAIFLIALVVGFFAARRRLITSRMSKTGERVSAVSFINPALEASFETLADGGYKVEGVPSQMRAFLSDGSFEPARLYSRSQPDLVAMSKEIEFGGSHMSLPAYPAREQARRIASHGAHFIPQGRGNQGFSDQDLGYPRDVSKERLIDNSADALGWADVVGHETCDGSVRMTPPCESGFESTGSDLDASDHLPRVVGRGSFPIEEYDLDQASMGFSEMSFPYDTASTTHRTLSGQFRYGIPEHVQYPHMFPTLPVPANGPELVYWHRSDASDSASSDSSFTCSDCEQEDAVSHTPAEPIYGLRRVDLGLDKLPLTSSAEDSSTYYRPLVSKNASDPARAERKSKEKAAKGRKERTREPAIADNDPTLNWSAEYSNFAPGYQGLGMLADPFASSQVASGSSAYHGGFAQHAEISRYLQPSGRSDHRSESPLFDVDRGALGPRLSQLSQSSRLSDDPDAFPSSATAQQQPRFVAASPGNRQDGGEFELQLKGRRLDDVPESEVEEYV